MPLILPAVTESSPAGTERPGPGAESYWVITGAATETAPPRRMAMPSPVVHFEIRSTDPDASRKFYGQLFGWTFGDGGLPGYSYVETGTEGAIPGGIGPVQDGAPLVTFLVGVADVAGTLEAAVAAGGRVVQPATQVPGVTFGLLGDPPGQGGGGGWPPGL